MIGRLDHPYHPTHPHARRWAESRAVLPLAEHLGHHPRGRRRVLHDLGHAFRRQADRPPFGGERGVFELSAGKKDIKHAGHGRHPSTRRTSMLLLGEIELSHAGRAGQDRQVPPAGGRLPAADAQRGLRRLAGQPPRRLHRPRATASRPAIEIRKDKPYVLDFSDKPEVHFQAPPKEKTFKPGDQIRLAAMLRIPDKGLLIGGLEDMSKKVGEMKCDGRGRQADDRAPLCLARSDRGHHRFLRKESGRGHNALWLRRHLRVLVASTKGPEALRRRRDLYRNRHLRHQGPLRQVRRDAADQAEESAGKEDGEEEEKKTGREA